LAAGKRRIGNNTAFINRMKMGNKLRRFLFCSEKAAVFETVAEG
jgi:hypothetical protein